MSLSQSWIPPFDRKWSSLSSLSRSTHLIQPTTLTSTPTTFLDPSYLSTLHTRALDLQHHLQSLLDIQSTHLTSDSSENGPITTTTTSTSSLTSSRNTTTNGRVIPVRQPHRPPPSLLQTRRAFSTTMTELSAIRGEESSLYSTTLASLSATASSINSWQSRRRELDAEVAHIEHTPEVHKLEQLKQDDTSLNTEIEALEIQLLEKRSQQRAIRAEIKTLENSVAGTLSSYQASEQILDNEIQAFLANQALRPNQDWRRKKRDAAKWMARSWSQQAHDEPSRQGLEAALAAVLEEVNSKAEEARREQDVAGAEQVALEEGVEVWNSVVFRLSYFEKTLGKWMKTQQQQQQQRQWEDQQYGGGDANAEILDIWDEMIQELQEHLEYVEEKGWNLLTCSIGAEVAALKLGRTAFTRMLGGQTDEADPDNEEDAGLLKTESPHILFTGSIKPKQDIENEEDERGDATTVAHPGSATRRGSARLSGDFTFKSARNMSPVRTYVPRRPVQLESENEDYEDEDEDDDDAPDADMLISAQR